MRGSNVRTLAGPFLDNARFQRAALPLCQPSFSRRNMADGDGIEPPRPCGRHRASNASPYHSGNHPCPHSDPIDGRPLRTRPALSSGKLRSCRVMLVLRAGWRKRQESNLQDLAVRTVFGTGPLANGVCASMLGLSEPGAPSWIRTSNLRLLRAAPLPDWTTGAAWGLDDARQDQCGARAGDKLSDNSASYSRVRIGSPVGPWPRI